MDTTTLDSARADALWQVELFAGPRLAPPARGTARARVAYQDTLYGRGLLVDLRSDADRAAQGRLGVEVLEVRPGVDLSALAAARRVYVITAADGHDPAELAALTPGHPEVLAVAGGFAGWAAAGLPVAA